MDVIENFDISGVTYREPDEYPLGMVQGQTRLLQRAPDYSYYAIASDDLLFHGGWYEATWHAMGLMGGFGLVGFNDLHSDGDEYAAHFLVSRDFLIQYHGGVIFPPLYKSWWCDREITDLAKSKRCYTWAKDAIVEHRNHAWQGIPYDATYHDAEPNYDQDYLTYQRLKDSGFPTTEWQPILR